MGTVVAICCHNIVMLTHFCDDLHLACVARREEQKSDPPIWKWEISCPFSTRRLPAKLVAKRVGVRSEGGCTKWYRCNCDDLGKPSEQHSARSYFRSLSFLACSTLIPSMNNLARGRSLGAFSLDVTIYPDANDAKRGSPSRGRGK